MYLKLAMATLTPNNPLFFSAETLDHQKSLLLAAVFLLVSLLFQLWRSFNVSQKLLFPLPPAGSLGLPFIGATLHLQNTVRRNMASKFVDPVTMYGETLKSHLIGDPTIHSANPTGNKMIFNNLCHVPWPAGVVSVIGKTSLIALNGEEAKRIQNAMMTFLRPQALETYTGKADKSVRRELLMSRYEKEEPKALEELLTTMMKGVLQLPISLPGTRYSKARAAAKMLRARFQIWINKRRHELALGKGSDNEDMLSCLLCYTDENGKPLSDENIKDNILLLLFAGHDTSAVVITMVCRYLALNPDVFDAVYRENKRIVEEKGPEEPLNWIHVQKMKLSWRVAQETLRMQAPIHGAFRVAMKDFDSGGFGIPKAWKLYWSTDSTHRNEKFGPSRFEEAGSAPHTFVPFGGGSRMCPGNEFARMKAMVLLHHLVTRFSWTLVDPHEVISVDPMPYPLKGLPIQLVSRNA